MPPKKLIIFVIILFFQAISLFSKQITIKNKSFHQFLNVNILKIETTKIPNPGGLFIATEWEKSRKSLEYIEKIRDGVEFELMRQATTLEITGLQEPGTVTIPIKTLQSGAIIDIKNSREYANGLIYSIENKSCTQGIKFINNSFIRFFNITIIQKDQILARYPEIDQKKNSEKIYIDPASTILEIQGTCSKKNITITIPIDQITPDVRTIEITGNHHTGLYYCLHYEDGSSLL